MVLEIHMVVVAVGNIQMYLSHMSLPYYCSCSPLNDDTRGMLQYSSASRSSSAVKSSPSFISSPEVQAALVEASARVNLIRVDLNTMM